MEEVKSKYYVLAVGIIVNLLALINDTTYTWSSPVLVKLLSNNTDINPLGRAITPDEETWIGSVMWIGAIFGSFPFGFMADKYGRKPIILLLAVPHIACFIIFAFARHIYLYYIARVIAGVSVSGIYLVLPMYLSEIVEDSVRGTFLFTYYMATNFGDLLSYVLGPYVSIKAFNLILAIFPTVFVVAFWLIAPESPTYLAGKDNEHAQIVLRRLRGRLNVEADMQTILREKDCNRSGKILQTLKKKYGFKALIISTGLQMFLTFTGMTVVLTYTEIIFSNTTGSKISADVSSIIVGLILFFSTLLGVFTIERAGRKILLIGSALGMIFAESLLGMYFYLQDHEYSNIGALQWMPLFCLVFFTVSYANGFGPLPFAITTEVCPSNVKFFIGTTVNVLGGIEYFALNKFFNDLNDNLGRGGTFWFFCGCCTLALLFVLFVVPETKGKSFQEIQEVMDRDSFVKFNICEKKKEREVMKLSVDKLVNKIKNTAENDEDPILLAEDLKSLNSDIDRIELVQRFAEKHNLPVFSQIECLGKICKSDERCVKLRQAGHEKFKAKEFFEAHQLFTESIANGHGGTENLGIAYAYRSAVLFEKGFFKECIEDLERAIKNNYPEDMIEKLTTRREMAQNGMQNQAEYHLPLPKLQHPNSLIPCASECVNIRKDDKLGRCIIAKRDIKAGEILSVEKPFVQIVHPTNQYLHCHECLELCYNLIPCANCRTVMYCSDNCKKTAIMSYHQYECDLFQLDFIELLSMRVVLKGLKDYKAMKKSDKDDVYRSDRYNEVYNLQINAQKRNPRDIFEAANEAYLYYYYFKNFSELFREFDIANSETVFKELIYRHHLSTSCNKIFIEKLRKNKQNTDFDKVGEAIYSFTSLFNHSCDPNATIVFYGSTAVARAIKDIEEGEQCLLNYRNYNFAEYAKQERYFALSTKYFFKCECEACENNWAVFDKLHVGDTEQYLAFTKKIEEAVESGNINNKETLNGLLNEGLRMASTMEEPDREPTKVLVNLRRLICELVKLSGNRLLEF